MRPHGYTLLISNSGGDAESEQQVVGLLLGCPQVEGLILASAQAPQDIGLFKLIEKHRLPYVLIDRIFPGLDANYVGANDEEIGALGAEHLIARGCRHIAHIHGPQTSSGIGRSKGYSSTLSRHGLKLAPVLLRLKESSEPLPPQQILIPFKLVPRESSKAVCARPC